jgi:hypothetical protein
MEVCSIAIGTFVAAGLARGRERAAGMISGITVSLWFVSFYLIDGLSDLDWSDVLLEGLIIIGAPLIGLIAAVAAREINRAIPIGFAGLNRFHLLWLWVVVFFYVGGLVGPIINIFKRQFGGLDLIAGLALGVPAGALGILLWAIPGYYGYALLSGLKGHKYQPIIRGLIGVGSLLLPAIIFLLIGLVEAATNDQ